MSGSELGAATAPAAVVAHLMAHDAFSQWMGVTVVEAAAGRSVLRMPVRADMQNGFGTLHGGVLFAFADSAFAFATNAGGFLSVAIDCSISFPVACRSGDVLTAVGVEQSTTNRLAFCEVTVTNQDQVTVGYFRGTVYRTTRPHAVPPDDAHQAGAAPMES
jgi:acyl-CoA thioesterase